MKEYRDILDFEPEHYLSKEPLRMDMLIIKKKKDFKIDNPYAEMFRKHNVIEYKSPKDGLSIDDFYKTIGYACIYKGLGGKVGEISEKELTVSIFRHAFPRELFSTLKNAGAEIEKVYDGVYRVKGIINLPTQIVVTKELEKGEHSALKILTGKADEFEVRKFINDANSYITPADKHNADAVLQVSILSNEGLYEMLGEEKAMCEALRNLMKDEWEAQEAIVEARGEVQGVNKLKEAILAIKNGEKPSKIKKKYGEGVYETAVSLVKSFT